MKLCVNLSTRDEHLVYRECLDSPAHLAEFLEEGHAKSDSGLVMLVVGSAYTEILRHEWFTDLLEAETYYDNLIQGNVGYLHGVPFIYRYLGLGRASGFYLFQQKGTV